MSVHLQHTRTSTFYSTGITILLGSNMSSLKTSAHGWEHQFPLARGIRNLQQTQAGMCLPRVYLWPNRCVPLHTSLIQALPKVCLSISARQKVFQDLSILVVCMLITMNSIYIYIYKYTMYIYTRYVCTNLHGKCKEGAGVN